MIENSVWVISLIKAIIEILSLSATMQIWCEYFQNISLCIKCEIFADEFLKQFLHILFYLSVDVKENILFRSKITFQHHMLDLAS